MTLTVGGQDVGSGQAGPDGSFAVVVAALPEGPVTLTANAKDPYGRNSSATQRSFTVDALPPAPVTITAPPPTPR